MPVAASPGRRNGKGDTAPFLKAVRYVAPAPTLRWPVVACASVGTDCDGLEVAMSVLEDLQTETDHAVTFNRLS